MGNNSYDLIKDMHGLPTCGLTSFRDFVDMHFHYAVEIIYMVGNRMTIFIGTEKITLSSGEYICINSGVAHATENISGDLYYLCAIPKYTLMPSIQMFTGDFFVGRDDEAGTIRSLLECFRHKRLGKKVNSVFVTSISNSIMSLILECKHGNRRFIKRSDPFFEMISYICDNYYVPTLTTDSLAKRFGYTPRMLSDLFRANLKIGVKRYIDILRVNDAKYRLLSTPDSVEAIALAVGFDSLRSFYRVFSAHTGISPGRYRNATPDDLLAVNDQVNAADNRDNTEE